MKRLLLIGFLALWADSGWAQQGQPGGYVGIGLGNFSYEEEVFPDIYMFDESASAWKIYGGYNWTENWGVEASWVQTDDLEDSASGFDPVLGNVFTSLITDVSALSVRAMGYLPISWGSLFAGIGVYVEDTDAEAVLTTDAFGMEVFSDSFSEKGATVIFGVQWAFSTVDFRIDYEWFDLDDADGRSFGLGLAYRF